MELSDIVEVTDVELINHIAQHDPRHGLMVGESMKIESDIEEFLKSKLEDFDVKHIVTLMNKHIRCVLDIGRLEGVTAVHMENGAYD